MALLEASPLPFELHRYRPRTSLRFEAGDYVVKTAEGPEELLQALRLRHDVFYAERLGRTLPGGLDVDAFDARADHVLVMTDGRVVAAYRLLCSLFTARFYSETEFDLEAFMAEPRVKLELGRACTAPDHRGGAALALVWKGLALYARRCGARLLFGTTSVDGMDPQAARDVVAALGEKRSERWDVRPRPEWAFPGDARTGDPERGRRLVPPLLRSYLRAGARVHGEPGLDRDLETTDLFTVIDLDAMDPRFAARFFGEPA